MENNFVELPDVLAIVIPQLVSGMIVQSSQKPESFGDRRGTVM